MRRILVFRHGVVINRWFMEPMARFFRRRGYEVHNRSYPTTRKRIEEHARDLSAQMLDVQSELEARGEAAEFYVVTHSMGGLVLRYALTHFEMPPIKRAVLVVPPNQGSATARFYRNFPPFRWIFGKAGAELSEDPPGIFGRCGVPDVDIGLLIGNVRFRLHPGRLERPHDGVVTRAEAMLGNFPLKALPHSHTGILFRRRLWEETAHFLEHGRFTE